MDLLYNLSKDLIIILLVEILDRIETISEVGKWSSYASNHNIAPDGEPGP